MPEGVKPFDVVVCVCLMVTGEFPLLRKNIDHPLYGGLYGFPAGKVEAGEDLIRAAQRELKEETDNLVSLKNIMSACSFPCLHEIKDKIENKYQSLYFNCHVFWIKKRLKFLKKNPREHEHVAFVQEESLLAMEPEGLFPDLQDTLRLAYKGIRYKKTAV